MAKKIDPKLIEIIKTLRSQGWSLPELHKKYSNIGYGTIFRHVKDIEISPKYMKILEAKRKTSIRRKDENITIAVSKAKKIINKKLSKTEALLLISALYWAEGTKSDFSLNNSDPNMIGVFVKILFEQFNLPPERVRISIRLYEDMKVDECKSFWLKVTKLQEKNISGIEVIHGKKTGKLKYGLCRIRLLKGADMLKYLTAIKNEVIINTLGSYSSTDRTGVS